MIHEPGQFQYFISEKEIPSSKGVLLLISLAGPINRSNAPFFEKLLGELADKDAQWVILSLRDVDKNIERPMYSAFARLQKLVRDRKAELKLCGLHPELRIALEQAGILRPQEVANNLEQALYSLAHKPA